MFIESRLSALHEWLEGSDISSKLEVLDKEASGRGVYARDTINRGECVVRISSSHLLNSTTVLRHITRYNPEITLAEPYYQAVVLPPAVHDPISQVYLSWLLKQLTSLSGVQLVSLFLVMESQRDASWWKPFIDMLPHIEELSLSPFVWQVQNTHLELYDALPSTAKAHTQRILVRFNRDYTAVNLLHHISKEVFLWAWMGVNSRCLYMDLPLAKEPADNFTMVPYADFLNHTDDDQCVIKIDLQGFKVMTSTPYKKGDQLLFSYGPHANEFLLCEYGFALQQNKWNYIDISEWVEPLLKPQHKEFLKELGYLGDFTVNASGMSFRTEVAFATMQESTPDESTRLRLLIDGNSDGAAYAKTTKILLHRILELLVKRCEKHTPELDSPKARAVAALYNDIKAIAVGVLASST